jgi:hypothetical protein
VGPNITTSYGWGLPPSMPGEPIGMPGTARPVALGFSDKKRRRALAGTWPSITYPPISAVWQAREIVRNTKSLLHGINVSGVDNVGLEARLLQMLHPS